MIRSILFSCVLAALVLVSPAVAEERLEYAIAIHGGAGSLPKHATPEDVREIRAGLTRALSRGKTLLALGRPSLEVVEAVVRILEDDPRFNAGRGAVFTAAGTHELDASIMDGRDRSCGAVAGVRTVKNPITLARLVMTRTRHVLLTGDGVHRFAEDSGVELVENGYFSTESRRRSWERKKKRRARKARRAGSRGTVGCVAMDRHGNLAAATSTGGLTDKMWGRVGDSPIIGAGTYADDRTCAVSCTGTGEEFIRHGVARDISARMEYQEVPLDDAVRAVIEGVLRKDDGGVIAVDGRGHVSMRFNTRVMKRGMADSTGRFVVTIE